jgi:hypothetical protein
LYRSRIEPFGAAEFGEREIGLLLPHGACVHAERKRGIGVAKLIGDPADRLPGAKRHRGPGVASTVQLERTGATFLRSPPDSAPDAVHVALVERFGKEASAYTRGLVEGERGRLEYEPDGRTDRDGWTLARVYLEDGRLLNLEIIEEGYGHAYTKYPFARMEEFRAAERYAREADRGLWADKADGTEDQPTSVPRESPSNVPSPGTEPLERWQQPPGKPGSAEGCTPRSQCCKVCSRGIACGNSCIRASYTCSKGRGCACNAFEVCR